MVKRIVLSNVGSQTGVDDSEISGYNIVLPRSEIEIRFINESSARLSSG